MAESKLKAELTADASQFTAEMAKASKANQDFMTVERLKAEVVRAQEMAVQEAQAAATAAGEKLTSQQVSQINRIVKAWTEQSQRMQYSKGDMRDMQAAQLGITGSTDAFRSALAQSAAATEKLGHGAAGARKEVLVLAHEAATGAWSNFGGSLLVLGERLDAMKYLMNPVALGIAAIAGASYGAYSAIHGASEEFTKFNQSLVLTNNWAGLTNETAAALAKTISGDVGTSFQAAREAVDATAASGKVLGQDMQTVTEIALQMAKSTGESFDKALDSVLRQQDGVSKAADDWQASHHDMDAATLEHIKSLDQAGDHTTALRILYAQELETMKKGTDTQVGSMSAIWSAFLDKWSRIKRQIAGSSTDQDKRADLVASLTDSDVNPGGVNTDAIKAEIAAIDARTSARQKDKDAADAVRAAQDRLNEADTRANKLLEQGASNEQKRTKAINEANAAYQRRIADAKTAGVYTAALDSKYAGQRDTEIANAARMYQDPKAPRAKTYTDDAATRMLQQLRDQGAAVEAQLSTTDKLTTSEQELAKFNQQVSDWKGKTLTADQKSLLANQDQIRAQLQKNIGLEKEQASNEAINKLKQRAAAIDAQILNYQESQSEQYRRQLSAVGLGQDAQKQAEAVRSIYKEYEKLQFSLEKETPLGARNNPKYEQAKKDIQDGLQQSLKDYSSYYAELKAKQADWTNGASAAVADYLDDASNKMKQTETLFNDVTGGMESAWVQFAQTGKLSFTSLANSVIADLARMQAKAAISGLLGSLASIGGSLAGGWFASNTGAAAVASNAIGGDSLDNFVALTGGFGTIQGHATGGVLSGPGTGTSDDILIRASNGESILTADATKRLGGSAAIDAINSGSGLHRLARFATGGMIGSTMRSVSASSARGGDITINAPLSVEGGPDAGANQSNGAEFNKKITAAIKAVVNNERRQGGSLWKLKNGIA